MAVDSFDAAKLDQNQREITHYGVAAYQYAGDTLNFQVAPFIRYSQTRFTPDPNHGDMIFNGFADAARLSSLAAGVQADASQQLGSAHTLRFGVFFQNEHTTSKVASTRASVDRLRRDDCRSCRPATCRSRSSTRAARPASSTASICRTNGSSRRS